MNKVLKKFANEELNKPSALQGLRVTTPKEEHQQTPGEHAYKYKRKSSNYRVILNTLMSSIANRSDSSWSSLHLISDLSAQTKKRN